MKCDYCDKNDSTAIYAFTKYRNRIGFEEISDSSEYNNFTGRS